MKRITKMVDFMYDTLTWLGLTEDSYTETEKKVVTYVRTIGNKYQRITMEEYSSKNVEEPLTFSEGRNRRLKRESNGGK